MFNDQQLIEARTPGATSPLDIILKDGRIPGRMTAPRGKPRALVIGFHGAVRRKKRELPVYFPRYEFLAEDCYQFHPCDPELFAHPELQTSWFAGSRERPLQSLLPKAFAALSKRLDVEKVIYSGASAGGFAALYYSKFHPRSIAIALQPQIDVYIYDRKSAEEYVERCWPNHDGGVQRKPTLKLTPVYSKRRRNSVIYMQSSGDWHHYRHHFLPFYDRLRQLPDQMLFTCDAWDPPGHRPVPADIVARWFRAAVEAETHKAQDILAARYRVEDLADAQIVREDDRQGTQPVAAPRDRPDNIENLSRQLTQVLLEREV